MDPTETCTIAEAAFYIIRPPSCRICGIWAGIALKLHLGIVGGHVECVRLLLEHGADATLANALGETALHVAAWDGHADVISALLTAGASLNKTGPEGETPLLLAADGGHIEVRTSCKAVTCSHEHDSCNAESIAGILMLHLMYRHSGIVVCCTKGGRSAVLQTTVDDSI